MDEALNSEQRETLLREWCAELLSALELEEVEVDVDVVLSLAGVAAHAIVRPAAPLTTFIAGYAAGLAAGSGQAGHRRAMDSAMVVARSLAESRESRGGTVG